MNLITHPSGLRLAITRADNPPNPRHLDRSIDTRIVCWHPHHLLGDEHDWPTKHHFLHAMRGLPCLGMPLYFHDQGAPGIAIEPDGPPWEADHIGWIYIDQKTFLDQHLPRHLTPSLREKAFKSMRDDVREYNEHLRGDVWCARILGPEDEVLDFIDWMWGLDWAIESGQRMLDDCAALWRAQKAEDAREADSVLIAAWPSPALRLEGRS